jgi:3-hydroxyacyl-CoA dehydrogenase/enoyl-CoA hydratase/3-hydroxybutyryl-CoA epimerase
VKHYPAVGVALSAVERGLTQSMEAGLAAERDGIAELLFTPTCRGLIGLFFQRERARSGEDWVHVLEATKEEAQEKPAVRIGVIGGGVMGGGIAQLALQQGFPVVLKEINQELLDTAMSRLQKEFDGLVKKRRLRPAEAAAAFAQITPAVDWQPLEKVDIAVEAATEREDIKRELFAELDRRLPEASILATNTSALSVERLAEATNRPDRVAGLHFFNPVHRMQLVEVVRAVRTSDETTGRLIELVRRLGKTPVVVADSPGFLVNRILFPYLNEAMRMVCEGIPADQIDRDIRKFGMPMGPLELIDQVGLDVAAHVAATMAGKVSDPGPSAELLARMVQQGNLGRKSGSGFYLYKKGTRGKPAPLPTVGSDRIHAVDATVGSDRIHAVDAPLHQGTTNDLPETLTEIQRRLVLLFINEAARCLEEKIVAKPWMVDMAMVFGTGFAPFRGGPLRTADGWEVHRVVDTLKHLERSLGGRFAPCALLQQMSIDGRRFFSEVDNQPTASPSKPATTTSPPTATEHASVVEW